MPRDADAMHKRDQCRRAGVCLTSGVTFVYCVQTAEDTVAVATEFEYETVPKLLNCTIFNDLERPLTQISRSRQYITLIISETV